MTSEPPVVLLGGGASAVSAARSMARRGRPVHVLPESPGPFPARASRYVRHCPRLPPDVDRSAVWLSWLGELEPSVVVPCGDAGVEFVADQRSRLTAHGHWPAVGDDEFLHAVLDKRTTYALADRAGVPRPRTADADTPDAAVAAARELGFPCGLKPRFSHRFAALGTPAKAVVVHDERMLAGELEALLARGAQMLLTEIVPGPEDAYCSYYGYRDRTGKELLHYTKRKLRQYPTGFGNGTYHRSEHVEDAVELGRLFFAGAGLLGLGNVEFKRDARDGQLKLIECNPRLTAATELIRRCGVDLAELVYADALGRVVPPGTVHHGLHQWWPLLDVRAMLQGRREGSMTARAWARSLAVRKSRPLWDLRDPGPSLVHAATVSGRAVRRLQA